MDTDSETDVLPAVAQIRAWLNEGASETLHDFLGGADVLELAELLFALSQAEREILIQALPLPTAAQVFTHLDLPVMNALLNGLGPDFLGQLVPLLEPDDAADLVGMLTQNQAKEVLGLLLPEDRETIRFLLTYPEDTAGGLMDPDVVRVNAKKRVGAAIEEIRAYVEQVKLDGFFSIFVVGADDTLLGTVENWKLLLARPEQRIAEIMEQQVLSVPATMDQEEITHLVRDHDLVVIPVVDEQNRLIGRITVDDILDVIDEEHHEDLGRMSGTGTEEIREFSVWSTVRARAPFLLVALAGEFTLAVLMREQEGLLRAIPALAFFIPLIMAMGGNTGMQSASLVIRGLATGEVQLSHFWRRLRRELLVALGIGCTIALIVVGGGKLITGKLDLGIAVGLASLTLILLATTMGALIPMLLKKLGFDPALAAGPFITTMNDILGILVYLGIALWMVG